MRRLLALTILLLYASGGLAQQVEVEGVRLWSGPDHTRVVFDLSSPVEHRLFTLKGPDRVVVDMESAAMSSELVEDIASDDLLRSVRSAPRNGGDLRVVFDLSAESRPKSFLVRPNDTYGHRLVVDLQKPSGESDPVKTLPTDRREIVIAVDAGHGGEDPGAIGPGGTHEKAVVLGVARKLAQLIDGHPGMRALLIREGDYYIGLRERTRKAREAQADMFVSVHADAIRDHKVRGSSVYVLSHRGASSEMARMLAQQENAADQIGGVSLEGKDGELAQVLLDLSRAATIESSVGLADSVLQSLEAVGPVHREQVEQAGFVVLKSLDMPSVLVELAFISNPAEERRLRTGDHQWKLARAVHDGVVRYARNNMPGLRMAEGQEYVVRSGDTLSGIANRYGVTVGRLRQANELSDDTIMVGSRLVIP